MTRRYYPISSKSWTTEDALDFSRESLIRDGRKLIEEKHPELLEHGINQDTVINVQAKQLLKARKNAESWVAANRRDQAKIAELRAELKAKDARIAELETLVFRATGFMESHIDMIERTDHIPATFEKHFLAKLQQTLKGGE